jgi:hypothetical protein
VQRRLKSLLGAERAIGCWSGPSYPKLSLQLKISKVVSLHRLSTWGLPRVNSNKSRNLAHWTKFFDLSRSLLNLFARTLRASLGSKFSDNRQKSVRNEVAKTFKEREKVGTDDDENCDLIVSSIWLNRARSFCGNVYFITKRWDVLRETRYAL